jgi:uncharacterized DUF497 family protein
MDVHLLFRGQRFVWNAEKATANESKHGVRFETACEIFFDPMVRLEEAGVEDEARDAAVGFTEDWRLLFVVHLIREDDAIRIVSARPATAQERRAYEDCE